MGPFSYGVDLIQPLAGILQQPADGMSKFRIIPFEIPRAGQQSLSLLAGALQKLHILAQIRYFHLGQAVLPGAEEVPVLNLKADPRLIGPQREKPGFFPAYHMNKEHWITAALDGSAPEDEIKILLAMSYDLTAMTRASRKNTT